MNIMKLNSTAEATEGLEKGEAESVTASRPDRGMEGSVGRGRERFMS